MAMIIAQKVFPFSLIAVEGLIGQVSRGDIIQSSALTRVQVTEQNIAGHSCLWPYLRAESSLSAYL